MASRQQESLIIRALEMAVGRRWPGSKIAHLSDHGSQYTSGSLKQVWENAKVTISLGSVSDCCDNTTAESFFAALETVLIDRHPGSRFEDWARAKAMIFDYLAGFYNTRRLHFALEFLSSPEFERRYAQTK